MTGRLILRRKISPARMFLELLFVCTAMAACARMVWQKGLEHNCTSDDVVMGSFPATCTTLDLSNRSVSDYQMKELAASFGASPRLHSVDLSGNQLSDDGARELATAIPGSRLKRIALDSYQISPLAHVPATQAAGGTVVQRAYTGALATEAVCCQLSAEGALLVGTRRLRVAAVASSRPQLRLRCEAALRTPRRSSPRAT